MKVFCWDCGPDQWGRRISVFEPVEAGDRAPSTAASVPAQECLKWVLQHPAVSVAVPAMNAMWEVDQNLQSVAHLGEVVDTGCFALYQDRLWDAAQLAQLARGAESPTIRERAAALLV
jgi:hypothetical protein